MKVAAIVSALALLVPLVRAQESAVKPGSIDGTVTNSVTGEPVKKAAIGLGAPYLHANTDGDYGTITDAAGHFHFENVQPGTYVIRAERDGFWDIRNNRPGLFSTIVLKEDQHVQDIAIQLMPLAVISGHVLDDDGDPIVRASALIFRYSYAGGKKQLQQAGSTQSNDLGEFEFLNLQPGRYYVQAFASPPSNIPPHTRWAHGEEEYPATFYQNAREIGQATATDVAAGAHAAGIDVRLRKAPAYHVRGTVTGAPTEVGTGVVTVRAPNELATNSAGLASDGSFDIRGVPSGLYDISYTQFGAKATTRPSQYSSQSIRVADADVNAVALTRQPEMELHGTIVVEGDRPERLNVRVSLCGNKIGAVSDAAAPDGSFTIFRVPSGVCDLDLDNLPSGKYVKSIHYGDREIKAGQVDFSNGVNGLLNIVLGSDGGEVDGNVQSASSQAAAGVQVVLAPAEESNVRPDLLRRVATDASGNFQIKDVAPGDYKVSAWESDSDGIIDFAEFRKLFDGKGALVTVDSRQKASVSLAVITEDEIEQGRSKLP
jgi:hypothetical protein